MVTDDRAYVSTGDFDLTEVATFDDLLGYLKRLRARASDPSYREVERRTTAKEGIDQLGRNKMTRILANGKLGRDELTSFLFAHGVRQEDYQAWYDARGRAAEGQWAADQAPTPRATKPAPTPRATKPAPTPRATKPAPTPEAMPQADPLAVHIGGEALTPQADAWAAARRLLQVRDRCLARLRRLNRELDHAHATADTDADHATRLVRTFDFAVSRLREIITEACAEVMAVAQAADDTAAGGQPSDDADGDTAPSDSAVAADSEADAAEADTATLSRATNVMGAVPLPVFAAWLRSQSSTEFNVIARERPQLMASLLATVREPDKAAAWLLTWEQDSAAEALAAAGPEEAERYLRAMAPKNGAPLLARMNPLTAARTLTAMRREVATGYLMAIGAVAGAPILGRLDREVCVGVLSRMHRQNKALAEKFMGGMDVEAASECLERMDEQMAEQRQARDLFQKVSQRRNRSGSSPASTT